MSTLHIIYDPTDKLVTDDEGMRYLGVKVGKMPLSDDLDAQDIYAVARRLAEMLLEQISR